MANIKYTYKTQHEYEHGSYSTELIEDSISETIPGQSHSITEILIRFQNGTLPNITKNNPYYETHDDFDSNDITEAPDFDLTDAENFSLKQQQLKLHGQQQRDLKEEQEKLSESNTKKTGTKDEAINDDQTTKSKD